MEDKNTNKIMTELIQYTRERALEYKTFTGAFIVKGDEIVQSDITSIAVDGNPLAHAELKVINGALRKFGGDLKGCSLFTTQQPCPMCASAIVWSGIEKVYFGIQSGHQWKYPEEINEFFSRNNVECNGPRMEKECREIDEFLIANWI